MFKRITDNQLSPSYNSLNEVFDEIRMRDAEEEPPAYIKYGNLILELRRAGLRKGWIDADVRISIPSNSDVSGTP